MSAFLETGDGSAAQPAGEIADGNSVSLNNSLGHEFTIEVKNSYREVDLWTIKSHILDVSHIRLMRSNSPSICVRGCESRFITDLLLHKPSTNWLPAAPLNCKQL